MNLLTQRVFADQLLQLRNTNETVNDPVFDSKVEILEICMTKNISFLILKFLMK